MVNIAIFIDHRLVRRTQSKQKMAEEQFTPTGLIADKAPGWLSRGILYILFLVVCSLLVWSAFSQVDVTTTGKATVVPDGRVRVIQSPVSGIIATVKVKEGQAVRQNEVLAVINSEDIHRQQQLLDESESALQMLRAEKNEVLPLRIALDQKSRDANNTEITNITERIDILNQQLVGLEQERILKDQSNKLALKRLSEERKKLVIDHRNAKLNEELRWSELKTRQSLKSTTVSQEEIDRFDKEARKAKNEVEKLDVQLRQFTTDQALNETQSKIQLEQLSRRERDIRESILKLKTDANRLHSMNLTSESDVAEYIATLGRNLAAGEIKVDQTRRRLEEMQGGESFSARNNEFEVRAPLDGIVAQAAILHQGAVVEAGGTLFDLVPEGIRLVAEIEVAGSGAGIIREQQPVKYRFEAFPPARYGILEGRVEKVSPLVEKNQVGEGTVLRVIADLSHNEFTDNGNRYPLRPGLTATAEIVTERQTILSLLFRPLKALVTTDTVHATGRGSDEH